MREINNNFQIKIGSKEGKEILEIMNQGKLVPSKVTCGLIAKAMGNSDFQVSILSNSQNKIFIIDGYPRNKENIDVWNETFIGRNKILSILLLDCSLDICMKRLILRSETSLRPDDQQDIIKKRFKGFLEEIQPILAYYSENEIPIINVDSSFDPNLVFEGICEKLEKYLV